MPSDDAHLRALQRHGHVVHIPVHGPAQHHAAVVLREDLRLMGLHVLPVAARDVRTSIGKGDLHRQPLSQKFRADLKSHRVPLTGHGRDHMAGRPVQQETAVQDPLVKPEFLADPVDPLRRDRPLVIHQADTGEIEFVGVLAQPVVDLLIAFLLLRRVAHRASPMGICGHLHLVRAVGIAAGASRLRVPSPLSHRTQRKHLPVRFIQGLHPRNVGRIGKIPVTDRQRRTYIRLCQYGIMSCHQFTAIDRH